MVAWGFPQDFEEVDRKAWPWVHCYGKLLWVLGGGKKWGEESLEPLETYNKMAAGRRYQPGSLADNCEVMERGTFNGRRSGSAGDRPR